MEYKPFGFPDSGESGSKFGFWPLQAASPLDVGKSTRTFSVLEKAMKKAGFNKNKDKSIKKFKRIKNINWHRIKTS